MQLNRIQWNPNQTLRTATGAKDSGMPCSRRLQSIRSDIRRCHEFNLQYFMESSIQVSRERHKLAIMKISEKSTEIEKNTQRD